MKTAVGGLLFRGEERLTEVERCDATSDALPMQQGNMQILALSMLALAIFRWPSSETRKRGKVLREPGVGQGLVIIEGQQFPFSLPGLWQAPQPPKIGMIVEAEFRNGKLVAIRPVDARSGGPSRSRPAS